MKKYLSVFVASVILITTLFTSFTVNAEFSDVADDYRYKEAITTLDKLDVINGYDNGTFEPEKDITRAEFTKIIVYMLGHGELSTKTTQFTDVTEEHWANAHIKVAYDLGIINGFDDTTFKPDDPVTYEQALKMLVCTLGYQALAEQSGGYPQGYITQATALKLNDKVTGLNYSDNAPRGVIAQIMYNALEVNMYEPTSTGWVQSDKTLLNDYLGVERLIGTVVGVEDSTTGECSVKLYPGQMCIKDSSDNEYVLDYTEYTQSYAEMSAYLGRVLQVYYRQDKNSEDRWLVELDDETYSNTELVINSNDIESYENYTLKYYKEGGSKATNIKLNVSDLTVRYNGRALTSDVTLGENTYSPVEVLNEFLNPNSENFIYGTVKLMDSGSTGDYSIVDIYDYETIVAYSAPSSADYKITDKTITGNYLVLDPNSTEYKFTITENGSEVPVTSISSNDVVNYAKSIDGELYTVYLTSKSVTGTINALNLDNEYNNTITVDGVEYTVTDRFLKYMQEKEQKQLSAGMDITMYLDMFGNAEWGTVTVSNEFRAYAYVVDGIYEGDMCYLKLFAPTSTSNKTFSSSTSYKVKTYKIADKVKLNGKSATGESVLSYLKTTAESCNPDVNIPDSDITLTDYNQLIKVEFNSQSEVSDIVTVDDSVSEGTTNSDSSYLVRYKSMNPDKKYYVSSTSVKESNTGSTFYSIRSTTPMFVIPNDRTDVESYSLKSAITSNTMVSGGTYYLEAFDVNDTKYPGCLLVYDSNFKSGTAMTKTMPYKLVAKDIEEVYDEDEDDTFKTVSTYNSTTSITTTKISADKEFEDVEMGDVILFGLDSDKYADSVMKVQDYDEIKRILDGEKVTYKTDDGETKTAQYYWNETQEQTEDNNWQLYKFDWRYPKFGLNEPTDDYYETGGNVTNIFSRASMFNVIQVLIDDNIMYVTKNGFDESGVIDESSYEEIKISSSTKFLRYDEENETFTPYAAGTDSTKISISDLKEAKNYGLDCSKVLVTYVSSTNTESSITPTAKFVVIYD